jgi:hypothetical protein
MIAFGLLESPPSPGDGPAPPAAPRAEASRRLVRWAAAVALLPLPVWFIASAAFAPSPAWRAEYRASADVAGAGVVVRERQLQRYWDKRNAAVPGGLSPRAFVARWDTCLTLREAREIPFMLAADGSARLAIDGVERLQAQSSSGMRATRGENIRLEPGIHHLHVELEPRGWPSIALLASFDGSAPRAIGSGGLAAGIRATPPRDGPMPCPAR